MTRHKNASERYSPKIRRREAQSRLLTLSMRQSHVTQTHQKVTRLRQHVAKRSRDFSHSRKANHTLQKRIRKLLAEDTTSRSAVETSHTIDETIIRHKKRSRSYSPKTPRREAQSRRSRSYSPKTPRREAQSRLLIKSTIESDVTQTHQRDTRLGYDGAKRSRDFSHSRKANHTLHKRIRKLLA